MAVRGPILLIFFDKLVEQLDDLNSPGSNIWVTTIHSIKTHCSKQKETNKIGFRFVSHNNNVNEIFVVRV